MRSKSIVIIIIVIILVMGGIWYISKTHPQEKTSTANISPATARIGQQTKTTGCIVDGPLQDSACTPGAVNPSLTKNVLCSPSFTTKSIRNVPESEKRQVYEEYGIMSHKAGQYEVDHLISLELGGSNEIANLWPEAAEPRPGFHEKDLVENYLHRQVCDGQISLQDAQQKIAVNWTSIYNAVPNIKAYGFH